MLFSATPSYYAFALLIAVLMAILIGVAQWARRQPKQTDEDQARGEYLKEIQAWEAKIEQFRHLLGDDIKSAEGKAEFVKALYGDEVPMYLWYGIPSEVQAGDGPKICEMFWGENGPHFGDFERHGDGLRIRNPKVFLPEIVLGERKFFLYQVGYTHFGDMEPGLIPFLRLYEKVAA